MDEDFLSFYRFTIFVVVLALVFSGLAVVYLEMEGREGGRKSRGGGGGGVGEARFDEGRWIEDWLNYTGGYNLSYVPPPTPHLERFSINLSSHPERLGQMSGEGMPASFGPEVRETSSDWVMSRLEESLLFYNDKAFYFKEGEYLWWEVGKEENISKNEINGSPVFVDRRGPLAFLITTSDPRGWEREAVVSGRELPALGGSLYLVDMRDGRTVFARRLPGLPVDARLSPPYMYVISVRMIPSGNSTTLRSDLYSVNLSTPGDAPSVMVWNGGATEFYWTEGGLLLRTENESGRFFAFLTLERGSARLKGIMNMTGSSRSIESVDVHNGYLRISVPGEGVLYFFQIPEGESSATITPQVKGFRLPDVGMSIEHVYLFGDYACITTFSFVGVTPRLFYAASPSSFRYAGEIPVVSEILFRDGDYVVAVRSPHDAPQASLIWWAPPASPIVVNSTSSHPTWEGTCSGSVVSVFYDRPYLGYLYLLNDSRVALKVILVDLNNETFCESGELFLPGYGYLEDIFLTREKPVRVLIRVRGGIAVSQMKSLDDFSFLTWDGYLPSAIKRTDGGYAVVGRYVGNGTVSLRLYSHTFHLLREIHLLKDVEYYTVKTCLSPMGCIGMFLDVSGTAEGDENIYFFSVNLSTGHLERRWRVNITGRYYLVDSVMLDNNRYLLQTCMPTENYTTQLFTFYVSNGTTVRLGEYPYLSSGTAWYKAGSTLYALSSLYFEYHSQKMYSTLLAVNLYNGSYWYFSAGFIPVALFNTTLVEIRYDGENFYLELAKIENRTLNVSAALEMPATPLSTTVINGNIYVLCGGLITPSHYYTFPIQAFSGKEQYLLHFTLEGGKLSLVESFRTSDAKKVFRVGDEVYLVYHGFMMNLEGGEVIHTPLPPMAALSADAGVITLTPEGVYRLIPGENPQRLL